MLSARSGGVDTVDCIDSLLILMLLVSTTVAGVVDDNAVVSLIASVEEEALLMAESAKFSFVSNPLCLYHF